MAVKCQYRIGFAAFFGFGVYGVGRGDVAVLNVIAHLGIGNKRKCVLGKVIQRVAVWQGGYRVIVFAGQVRA